MFQLSRCILVFGLMISTLASADWSRTTSDEYAPAFCGQDELVNAMFCFGRKCDNIQIHCSESPEVQLTLQAWTSYFSEEGTNYRVCSADSFIHGIACRGNNCDDIALSCRKLRYKTTGNCFWTGQFSEEHGGTLWLPSGYYAKGIQCLGGNCDNKRIYACQIQ